MNEKAAAVAERAAQIMATRGKTEGSFVSKDGVCVRGALALAEAEIEDEDRWDWYLR